MAQQVKEKEKEKAEADILNIQYCFAWHILPHFVPSSIINLKLTRLFQYI
jgi:hypothetical protein